MCKHFNTPQGCSYGDKCQFAHGAEELKQYNGKISSPNMFQMNNKQNNMLNYKIVKCKNWEKDKSCKYGAHCTFAHGDQELRNKADNLYQMNPQNVGMVFPAYMIDMSQMQQIKPTQSQINQINQMNQIGQINMSPMMMGMNNANFMQQQQINNNGEKSE